MWCFSVRVANWLLLLYLFYFQKYTSLFMTCAEFLLHRHYRLPAQSAIVEVIYVKSGLSCHMSMETVVVYSSPKTYVYALVYVFINMECVWYTECKWIMDSGEGLECQEEERGFADGWREQAELAKQIYTPFLLHFCGTTLFFCNQTTISLSTSFFS